LVKTAQIFLFICQAACREVDTDGVTRGHDGISDAKARLPASFKSGEHDRAVPDPRSPTQQLNPRVAHLLSSAQNLVPQLQSLTDHLRSTVSF
jgi:hypothetical protein